MPATRRVIAGLALAGTLSASCSGEPTAIPDDTIELLVISGSGQTGPPFTELPEPLVVQVVHSRTHDGLPGRIVNFRVVEGQGSVYAGTAITDDQGIAVDFWTLGEPGPQRVEARAVSPSGEKLLYGTFTATALTDPVVFDDEAAFLSATGATAVVTYPTARGLTNAPYVENDVTLRHAANLNNRVYDGTPVLPGNEFAVSGAENIDVMFAQPVTAVGFRLQDGLAVGDISGCPAGQDSRFEFTLFSGLTVVASFDRDPPVDEPSFFGVQLNEPVDRLEIREVGSTNDLFDPLCENDFLGTIFAM